MSEQEKYPELKRDMQFAEDRKYTRVMLPLSEARDLLAEVERLAARVKELEALEGRISGLCGPSGNAADDTAYGRVVSALSYQLSRVSELESENAKLREERCGHGWRGSTPEDGKRIATPCPACGARSLFIGTGGHLTCAVVGGRDSGGCPSPSVEETVDSLKQQLAEAQAQLALMHRTLAMPTDEATARLQAQLAEKDRALIKSSFEITSLDEARKRAQSRILDLLDLQERIRQRAESAEKALEEARRELAVQQERLGVVREVRWCRGAHARFQGDVQTRSGRGPGGQAAGGAGSHPRDE